MDSHYRILMQNITIFTVINDNLVHLVHFGTNKSLKYIKSYDLISLKSKQVLSRK